MHQDGNTADTDVSQTQIIHGGEIQMSFSVNTNLAALNAQSSLIRTNANLQKTLGRLTSGLRINSAADDAAGLAVANRHKLDNSGLQVGIRAANDGISKL